MTRADWVESLRLALGMDRDEFACVLHVSAERVHRWETGETPRPRDQDDMVALARGAALEIGPDGLWLPPGLDDREDRRAWLLRSWAWRARVQDARRRSLPTVGTGAIERKFEPRDEETG